MPEKFALVTGTADGADTAAAEGALDSGRLIFVAAQGLDHIYPAGSERLYKLAGRKGTAHFRTAPADCGKGIPIPRAQQAYSRAFRGSARGFGRRKERRRDNGGVCL